MELGCCLCKCCSNVPIMARVRAPLLLKTCKANFLVAQQEGFQALTADGVACEGLVAVEPRPVSATLFAASAEGVDGRLC